MAANVTVSLDVMGGDEGVELVIPGADKALTRRPDIRFLLFGDEKAVEPVLARYPKLREASTFEHCEIAVRMDDKPSQALRQGRRRSSMWRAIEAVKKGDADLAVSAGNTGALMAMAKFCLRTSAEIDRPAIAALWPTIARRERRARRRRHHRGGRPAAFRFRGDGRGDGAGGVRPRAADRRAPQYRRRGGEGAGGVSGRPGSSCGMPTCPNIDYVGFVEGDDLGKGTVDVVVTEGFSGNIALKTAEGTAKQIADYLRAAMSRTLMARIGYFLARDAFNRLREKMDPRRGNGGVFLGLNGIVIKSHGGTDPEGFATAVELGYSMVRNRLLDKINSDLTGYYQPETPASAAAVARAGAA